jgi:hypothetical protein
MSKKVVFAANALECEKIHRAIRVNLIMLLPIWNVRIAEEYKCFWRISEINYLFDGCK